MNQRLRTSIETHLIRGPEGEFDEAEVEGLPEPVQRYFRAAIAPGTPLARTGRMRMKGQIRIGRWLPFRARELLTPEIGFVWSARAAGLISGYDRYVERSGEMDWKLAGLVRVMHAGGLDVSRSAAERAAAEAVWVPTALLPRFGVEWTAADDTHVSARYQIDGFPVVVNYQLDRDGHVGSMVFERWGDPDNTGAFGLHLFGGEFERVATFHGLTIPAFGRLGWHYGTERWADGEFFRYTITDLVPLGEAT